MFLKMVNRLLRDVEGTISQNRVEDQVQQHCLKDLCDPYMIHVMLCFGLLLYLEGFKDSGRPKISHIP
jgi:hypothetical protein